MRRETHMIRTFSTVSNYMVNVEIFFFYQRLNKKGWRFSVTETYPDGTTEKQSRVSGVTWSEYNGRSGQGSSSFASHVRSRVGPIHLIHRSKRIHVFWPLPAVVIGVRVTHLDVNDVRHRRCLQEVIRPPFDGPDGVPQLRPHGPPKIYDAPRQQRRRKGHWEPELHIVSGVVVPTR